IRSRSGAGIVDVMSIWPATYSRISVASDSALMYRTLSIRTFDASQYFGFRANSINDPRTRFTRVYAPLDTTILSADPELAVVDFARMCVGAAIGCERICNTNGAG